MRVLSKPTDGIVSRAINRKISLRITHAILSRGLRITPNMVSVISFAIAAVAAFLYLPGVPILAAVAGALVQTSSIIDGVDGELARALGMKSNYGAWLDSMLDRLADIAVLTGAAVYISKSSNQEWVAMVAMLALAGTLMVSYFHKCSEHAFSRHPVFYGRVPSFASRDVRLFLIFLGSVLELVLRGSLLVSILLVCLITWAYVIAKFTELALLLHPNRARISAPQQHAAPQGQAHSGAS